MRKKKQKDKQTNRQTKKKENKNKKISWIRGFIQFYLSPILRNFDLCEKKNRKTNRQIVQINLRYKKKEIRKKKKKKKENLKMKKKKGKR